MKITISIVTYNNENEISKVLSSLSGFKNNSLAEVIVVDNASDDNTIKIVSEAYPWVKIMVSKTNNGFGAGHNLALRQVASTYHAFVNPDIIVPEGAIDRMCHYMDEHPEVAILTPKILNGDDTEQYLPKRHPTIKYCLGGRFESKGGMFRKWRAEYTRENERFDTPVEVDFCTGCFMFCRTDMLQKCGGFDERYFLYFEDADLTRKVKEFGKTVYHPDIYVYHEWKRGNNKTAKGTRIAITSMIKYLWKWR